jgi:MOSC domain-containing protein YiiM
MGEVIGIATRPKKRAPMDVYYAANVTFAKGVGDDSRGKFRNHRQVTVMSKESWDEVCSELDRRLHWATRRANILISGVDLENTVGNYLRIGKDVLLKVTGELEPCNRMDEQHQGLTEALKPNWRGGVCCELISEGEIKERDLVTLINK